MGKNNMNTMIIVDKTVREELSTLKSFDGLESYNKVIIMLLNEYRKNKDMFDEK